jgi:glycosyltransferase involved in cell wall biosynthesis
MIGTGPALPKLKAAAPDGVEYLGWVCETEKRERMARAHVHLATGLREGWGLVVTEAAALGTPTIAYDMPGLRDSTRAAGGVVVPPHPDALARWLVELLPRWQEFPPAPLAFGGAHSWDEVADTLLTEIDRHAA